MDFTEYDDDELDTLVAQARTEQERRVQQAQIPQQISDLSRTYKQGGGDPADLVEVVTHGTQ